MVVTHNRAAGPIQGCTFETANYSRLVPIRYLFIPARLNLLSNLQSSLIPKTHK